MMKRAEIIVRGRVQRVGYRSKVDRSAAHHNLTGFVKNLEDGTVKIVCEGKKAQIEDFVEEIRIDKYPIKVIDIEIEYSDATKEFEYFDIEREEDINEAIFERMDDAAGHLGDLVKKVEENVQETSKVGEKVEENIKETRKVGEKVDNVGEKVEENIKETRKVGEKVDNVGEKVEENIQETRAFREETVECFDRLDEKYHVVSENLVAMKDEMLESRKELSNLVKHIGVLVNDHIEKEERE